MTIPGDADRIILTPADIHLWMVFGGEVVDERLHSRYRELLSTAERRQEQRFYFERDRRRYLTTRALVRTVLSRYVAVHPADWMFSSNAYGRPDAVNAPARAACLSFNISHTHDLIVLAVSMRRALGVDVENVRARRTSVEIADRYFAPREVEALAAAPPDEQQYRFFEYWTFKEAYIKARGMGLSLPLDKFSFHYPDEHAVEIGIDRELHDDPAHWHFWQLQPAPDYLVAICAERIGDRSPSVTVRRTVPMLHETECTFAFQRVSEPASTP